MREGHRLRPKKYGRDHWEGCQCEDCEVMYNRHFHAAYPQPCGCQSCSLHRRHVIPKQKERLNPVATVNFCERKECQAMGKSVAMTRVYIVAGELTLDCEICPGCTGELIQWWDHAPALNRERAYQEVYKRPVEEQEGINPADLEGLLSAALSTYITDQGAKALPASCHGKTGDGKPFFLDACTHEYHTDTEKFV